MSMQQCTLYVDLNCLLSTTVTAAAPYVTLDCPRQFCDRILQNSQLHQLYGHGVLRKSHGT